MSFEHFLWFFQMSEDILELDYVEQSSEDENPEREPEPSPKRRRVVEGGSSSCAAQGCAERGTEAALREHWSKMHCSHVVLFLCPYEGCGVEKTWKEDMHSHLKMDHLKTSRLAPELECLPWIAQVVPNNKFVAPGEVAPLAPRPRVPEGSVRFTAKLRVTALLQAALRGSLVIPRKPSTAPAVPTEDRKSLGPSPVKVTPATSSTLASHTGGELEDRLRDLRRRETAIWQEREQVLRAVERQQASKVPELEQTVAKLRRRIDFLEKENKRLLHPDREPRPTIVGHLQSVPSTRALVLFPKCGTTSVYPLEQADIVLLDLPSRTTCLSSESLWVYSFN